MPRAGLFAGTAGYQYDHWRGVFYPERLRRADWFDFYAEHFSAIEINNTFYNLPKQETFDAWRRAAPRGFRYALKFSRYGTHMKKLKDPQASVPPFMRAAERLGAALGPVLVQLPGNWRVDVNRLRAFLEALPVGVRFAFEFRDRSWLCEDVFALLQKHGAALVEHDMLARHPRCTTADFVYRRFHGEHYHGDYSHQYLTARARRAAAELAAGREVYAFFNNDADGHAPANARDLMRYVAARG